MSRVGVAVLVWFVLSFTMLMLEDGRDPATSQAEEIWTCEEVAQVDAGTTLDGGE